MDFAGCGVMELLEDACESLVIVLVVVSITLFQKIQAKAISLLPKSRPTTRDRGEKGEGSSCRMYGRTTRYGEKNVPNKSKVARVQHDVVTAMLHYNGNGIEMV